MSNSLKLVLILLGPPGSGKGTQASLLAEKLNLHYLETSKVLEKAFSEKGRVRENKKYLIVAGKKYYFKDEKKLWEKGFLCSPPFVTELVKQEIQELYSQGKNLVLAGSPRTLYEGQQLTPLLIKLYGKKNLKIILLSLSQKESIFRNSHRRICSLMRHPILYNKETIQLKHCPLDGSELIQRKSLDMPETIKVRLKEYKKRTLPLVDYFESQGFEIKKVRGAQSVADVFKDILANLNI